MLGATISPAHLRIALFINGGKNEKFEGWYSAVLTENIKLSLKKLRLRTTRRLVR